MASIKKMAYQVENAQLLLAVKGARSAANYLRTCGWSLEDALYILLGIN